MNNNEKVTVARRWRAFYEEPGGLGEMFGRQMAELNRVGMEAVTNTDAALHERVMLSMKELTKLQQAVMAVMANGALAEAATEHARQVAELPERKRRWI